MSFKMSAFARTFAACAVSTLASTALADDGAPADAPPQRMRVEDCVTAALRSNPDVRSSADEVDVARASRWEIAGQAGPRLRVEGSFQQWDSPYITFFQLDPSQPKIPFPVRDQFTWNASASAIQPITGLLAIYEMYRMRDMGVDVAAIRREATQRDVAFHTIETFYRLLQAERLAEVAVASVDQLEGQLKRANSFHDNGVVSRDDVLRSELAVANAKQRLILMRAQVSVARARLAVSMGLGPDAMIDAAPLASEPATANDTSLEGAELRATGERVELREVDRHIDQAKSGVRVAWLKMGPQFNLIASYQHTEGSPFQQKDAEFVGGSLSWDVWDWGSSIAGVNEANGKLRLARTARTKIEDQVRLEVREAFLNLGAARDAMDVAKAAVASAEENYRLVNKRYEANSATSFDVVDAEGLLTQARGQLYTSTYDYLVARAALRRAMGENPQQQLAH